MANAWNDAWKKENVGSTIGGLASGAAGITNAALGMAQIEDTSDEQAQIDDTRNEQFGYGDFDSLMAEFGTHIDAKTNYTSRDLRTSYGQRTSGLLSSVAAGAGAGAMFSGVGAIVGAGAGLLAGIGGIAAGNAKARREARRLNKEARYANEVYHRNFANNAQNISNSMFNASALNIAALGGDLYNIAGYNRERFSAGGELKTDPTFTNGITFVNEGQSHEMNKLGGVPMGVDNEGNQNLVEEGEVIYNDYVYSRRLKLNKKLLEKLNLSEKLEGKSFADAAKELTKDTGADETMNDPITRAGVDDIMQKLRVGQEEVRAKIAERKQRAALKNMSIEDLAAMTELEQAQPEEPVEEGEFSCGGKMKVGANGLDLRYAPPIGSGLQIISDISGLTNREDYSDANLIRNARNNIRNVGVTPLGDRLAYNPMDINYELNRVQNANLGTQQNILNAAAGNRGAAMSGLLATNRAAATQRGDLLQRALDYNNKQRQAVAEFNRATNQANAQLSLNAQEANQRADVQRAELATNEAQFRDAIKTATSAARSNNINNLFGNLGKIGQDIAYGEMIKDIEEWRNPKSKNKNKEAAFGGRLNLGLKSRRK